MPLPNQIKIIIDIIKFQSAHIKFPDDNNRIHNDQIGFIQSNHNSIRYTDVYKIQKSYRDRLNIVKRYIQPDCQAEVST